MIRSRIREIRKARGLTLQQVADRANTTAQTIGRLETGMRTLSIDWVERIAGALGADPSELLSLPGEGDLQIAGRVAIDGSVTNEKGRTISPRLLASEPVVLRMERNTGAYREGDVIVCDASGGGDRRADHFADNFRGCIDRDCLVSLKDGRQFFARVISGSDAETRDAVDLVPIDQGGPVMRNILIDDIAPAVLLLREL